MSLTAKPKLLDFSIKPVQKKSSEKIKKLISEKVGTSASMGSIEGLAVQVCLIQNKINPILKNPVSALFAGDHGIYKDLKAYGCIESSEREIADILNGKAPINIFNQVANIPIKIIDAGLHRVFSKEADIIDAKIRRGTHSFKDKPAMNLQECRMAMDMAASIVDELHDQGSNTIGFGDIGTANNCSASAIEHVLTGFDIEECIGNSTMDPLQYNRYLEIIKLSVDKHALNADDPIGVLTNFGGYELAMLTGGMLKAAELRMIILVDGFVASTAALISSMMYPEVLDYFIFTHLTDEKGHQSLLTYLGAEPVLNLYIGLASGCGIPLAYPIVNSAVALLH
jgi:nicotinate-nucleotide--dimethylbenzimidazole phosphoribosyltransferase